MRKKLVLFLVGLIALSVCACSKQTNVEKPDGEKQGTETNIILNYEDNIDDAQDSEIAAELLTEIKLSIDSFQNGEQFELFDIPYGSSINEILKNWNITDEDLLEGSSESSALYTDKVVYKIDQYEYYPYVNMWNNGANMIYLCSVNGEGKDKIISLFDSSFGNHDMSDDNAIWEKSQTRIWVGHLISIPGYDSEYCIAIQKVTA